MRPTQTPIALAAFATAAVLSYFGAVWTANGVERRTRQIISHTLSVDGYDWVRVATDGLQIRLTGTAPTEAMRFKVLAIVDASVDAARVHDLMQVTPAQDIPPPRFSVEMLRNGDGISLIGLVPAATGHDAIAKRVAALTAPGGVTDLLETAAAPVPAGWDQALDYGLEALKELPRAKISISADKVNVTGIADSQIQQRQFETDLARAAPQGLLVEVAISAPRPVITPFTLRFVIDDAGSRFDACSADTDKARDQIVAAAVAAGVTGKVQCTVGMGVPTPHWAEAAVQGINAVKELGHGTITFSDADVSLLATDATPQASFDKVVGELGATLPDVFSLKATLPKKAAATKSDGPVEFTAALTPDGKVALHGRLTDDRMREVVDSYARARFGADHVFTATRADDKLPNGWPVRVLAGLQALSVLHDGTLLVQPDLVAVTGTAGVADAQDRISRILSEQLGQGGAFTIKVSYDKRYDPQAGLPTPQECVTTIKTAMAAHKIGFEPGSDTFTPDSVPTLDAIADELRKCPDVKMEIAGYTDSQGRAEMNLALSQARAQAVLTALSQRRVLVGNLVARGYGEDHPIADNGTDTGREANRRIEITLLADAPDAGQATAASDAVPDVTSPDQATDGAAPVVDPGTEPTADTSATDGDAAAMDSTGADATDGTTAPDSAAPAQDNVRPKARPPETDARKP
ncbi:MAG: OmpA family protein [Rhodobacteraceae bacterium]|nr:OmpA family protein [Paracoccaceae bacterium]